MSFEIENAVETCTIRGKSAVLAYFGAMGEIVPQQMLDRLEVGQRFVVNLPSKKKVEPFYCKRVS